MAESIRWFGGEGQHDGPWEIPIELFLDRVAGLRQDCDRVVVVGTSFGSEAALLTGARSDIVDAVVAFAPSDVVWAGVTADGRMTSHWTCEGAPIPFIPFADDWEPTDEPDLLLIAGGDDRVWPAVAQAEAIRDRRTVFGLETTLITDPQAVHRTILPGEPVVEGGMRMQRGGTESADRRLGLAAWQQIERLL